jgi:CRP-like cAMP-binding protein
MIVTANPRANHLLAALPGIELQRLLPYLERVAMPLGQVLTQPGVTPDHVYFPTSAIVPLLYLTEDGKSTEIAVIGNDGVVGISQFMGGGFSTTRAVVEGAGEGFRLKAQAFKEIFNRPGPAMDLLLRYIQALMTQMAQTAVCNRHHSVDQQLCRLLLQSLDRLPDNEIVITQELIAIMLGVRRESVTESARRLQEAGLIRYTRGHVQVRDRDGIEQRSCECYAVVKQEYQRLLPETRCETADGAQGQVLRHIVAGVSVSPPRTSSYQRMQWPPVERRSSSRAVY